MNERIKELAEQAEEYAHDEWPGTLAEFRYGIKWFEDYNKKLAELIVKECIKICSDVEADTEMDLSDGALVCVAEIKEHFGVEE